MKTEESTAAISVALVDDHADYGRTLLHCLAQEPGIAAGSWYPDGMAALEGLPQQPPDILIVDLQMPGMDGITLLQHLRALALPTQYLVCSSHSDNELVFKALRAGASGYILKSATLPQVIAAIRELHEGGAPMSPYIARKVVGNLQQPSKGRFDILSARENEILVLLATGQQYKEIAGSLGISVQTVKIHIRNIYQKLHVQNKVEAVNLFNQR